MDAQRRDKMDTVKTLAANVVDRARELIDDGWAKGRMHGQVMEDFCILGALELASRELLPTARTGRREVCRVAEGAIRAVAGNITSIPGWNDAKERTKDEVLSVLRLASERLWDEALADEPVAPVSRVVRAPTRRATVRLVP